MVTDAQAAAFLVERFGSDVVDVARIAHGEWSKAYAYRHAGVENVIRFSPLQEDFLKDRHVARYGSPALPIPSVLDIGQAFDGFFAISKRLAGTYLDEVDRPQLLALLPGLFGALDGARGVDLSGSSGYGLWGADGHAPYATWSAALLDVASDRPGSRTHGWRERLAASPTGSGPFEVGYRHLQTLVTACPRARHLVHADLLNYNVLVSDGRINGVIDWGNSLYGDFVYDVAWFAFWAPWYPAWRGVDFADEARTHYQSIDLNVPNFEERLRCYQVHIGLENQAYCALKGRLAGIEERARRTLEVLDL